MAILKIKDPTTGGWQEVTVMQGKTGPQGPAGPNEITANTATAINGLLKGAGGKVVQAVEGTDYATPDDAKAFVVTLTENTEGDLKGTYTSDKTTAEIYAAYNANKNIIGRFASGNKAVMTLMNAQDQDEIHIQMGYLLSTGITLLDSFSNNLWGMSGYSFMNPPRLEESLPELSPSLYENTIYNVSSPVGTYVFNPPEFGWAHGKFTTGSSVSVSFNGTFIGAAPTIEANKTYEFDVFDGVWAVQEVVTA